MGSRVLSRASAAPNGVAAITNQPMAATSPAPLDPSRRAMITGSTRAMTAPTMLTIWIAPNTRERS